jgi:hypothetical protein
VCYFNANEGEWGSLLARILVREDPCAWGSLWVRILALLNARDPSHHSFGRGNCNFSISYVLTTTTVLKRTPFCHCMYFLVDNWKVQWLNWLGKNGVRLSPVAADLPSVNHCTFQLSMRKYMQSQMTCT